MSDKPRKYMPKWLRRTLIFAPIALIVAGAGYGVYIYFTSATSTAPGNEKGGTTAISTESSFGKARAALLSEGPAAGQKVLDEELAKTSDPVDQAAIYGSKASIASSSEAGSDVKTAIDYALKAYELSPTSDNAALVAEMYRQAANNAKAIEYFKIAIDKIGDYSKADFQTQSAYKYYESLITELGP